MQLLPMASSPDGLISARYAVIMKTPGWERGGGGAPPMVVGRSNVRLGKAPRVLQDLLLLVGGSRGAFGEGVPQRLSE